MAPAQDNDIVTAAVLVIGDEILSGRTKDKNIGYIADHCTQIGIQLREVRIVADDEADIVAAVNALRSRYDYVFTTGGIGPTHDDITADCIAKAFGVGIDVDPRALALLKPYYEKRGVELTEGRLRMARIPDGADLIENSVSVAPGFMTGNVITLAGVPNIMQAMLDGILPQLEGGPELHARTVACALAEGQIAADLGALQDRYPDLEIGSYPYFRNGFFGVSLVLRGTDEARVAAATEELAGIVLRLGGTPNVTVGTKG